MLIALGGAVLRAPRQATFSTMSPNDAAVGLGHDEDGVLGCRPARQGPSFIGTSSQDMHHDMGCVARVVALPWLCRVVGTILTWLVSPFVLGGVAVILAFLLLVTQGQRSHFRKDREKLRAEFEQYRKQMQAKVRAPLPSSVLVAFQALTSHT